MYQYWMTVIKEKRYPVYMMKYEDVVADTAGNLNDIFRFFMAAESIEGTYVESRIKDTIAKQASGKTYERREKDKAE